MSSGLSGAGQDVARQSLAREMIDRDHEPQPPHPVVDRFPEPAERPDPRAQWDEVKGEWIVWDEDDDEWQELDDEDDG